MSAVPRLRDTLHVELSGSGRQFVVCERGGSELFRLTPEGWTLATLLDGVSSPAEVLAEYRARVGREMPEDELEDFCSALQGAGVLHTDPVAVEALTYLRAEGLRYRTPGPDRRQVVHPDTGHAEDPRAGADRRGDAERERAWGLAVVHLNEGRVDRALATFESLAAADLADVRSREFLHHLRFLAARGTRPDLGEDRRDGAWRAFDEALAGMLDSGRCPRCGDPIALRLGGANRCGACGSSFSAFAVRETRARVPELADDDTWPWAESEDAP